MSNKENDGAITMKRFIPCCEPQCESVAEFMLIDSHDLDPCSGYVYACAAHLGGLVGHSKSVELGEGIPEEWVVSLC